MKIALLMPQSKTHENRSIFGRWLRYAPLTLTTLAALVPGELGAEITLIDEGVEDLDPDTIDADIAGITCITPINNNDVSAVAAQHIGHVLTNGLRG